MENIRQTRKVDIENSRNHCRVICYRFYSRTVRRMNSDLKKWKSAQKTE